MSLDGVRTRDPWVCGLWQRDWRVWVEFAREYVGPVSEPSLEVMRCKFPAFCRKIKNVRTMIVMNGNYHVTRNNAGGNGKCGDMITILVVKILPGTDEPFTSAKYFNRLVTLGHRPSSFILAFMEYYSAK